MAAEDGIETKACVLRKSYIPHTVRNACPAINKQTVRQLGWRDVRAFIPMERLRDAHIKSRYGVPMCTPYSVVIITPY